MKKKCNIRNNNMKMKINMFNLINILLIFIFSINIYSYFYCMT